MKVRITIVLPALYLLLLFGTFLLRSEALAMVLIIATMPAIIMAPIVDLFVSKPRDLTMLGFVTATGIYAVIGLIVDVIYSRIRAVPGNRDQAPEPTDLTNRDHPGRRQLSSTTVTKGLVVAILLRSFKYALPLLFALLFAVSRDSALIGSLVDLATQPAFYIVNLFGRAISGEFDPRVVSTAITLIGLALVGYGWDRFLFPLVLSHRSIEGLPDDDEISAAFRNDDFFRGPFLALSWLAARKKFLFPALYLIAVICCFLLPGLGALVALVGKPSISLIVGILGTGLTSINPFVMFVLLWATQMLQFFIIGYLWDVIAARSWRQNEIN